MTNGAICDGGEAFYVRVIRECPAEHKVRRIVGRFQHWYGFEWYCLGCGDRWTMDEFGPRPFERGWRAKAIANHKAMWDAAPAGSWRSRRPAFLAFMNDYFSEVPA